MARGLALLLLSLLLLGAVCAQQATSAGPPTKSLTLDFASTLEGIGCNCAQSPTQAEILAKCATCACSDYGCCRPPDCDSPACGGCSDCSRCDTGPGGHACVTTPVQRQCWFAVGTTVLNPFQVVAKMTVVYWDAVAYAWLSYAANSQRASFEVQFNGTNVFAGQPSLTKLPGFAAPPQLMYYSTGVFGPLDWSLLGPRFNSAAGTRVRICDIGGACSNALCVFGQDKPVLRPADVGL